MIKDLKFPMFQTKKTSTLHNCFTTWPLSLHAQAIEANVP